MYERPRPTCGEGGRYGLGRSSPSARLLISTDVTGNAAASLVWVGFFAVMEFQEVDETGDFKRAPGQVVITRHREGAA